MFFRVFSLVIFLTVFFAKQALAVQPGEMFWEIKKRGDTTANYLIGTVHNLTFNEHSLSPEIITAMTEAKIGIFEIISSERTVKDHLEAGRNIIRLPQGKTLSLYLGEEKTEKLFSAFVAALSRLDESNLSSLIDDFREINLDIQSYSEFNTLKPIVVIQVISQVVQELKTQEIKGGTEGNAVDKGENFDEEREPVTMSKKRLEEMLSREDETKGDKTIDLQKSEGESFSDKRDNELLQEVILDKNDKPDIETCLLDERKMDTYIEEVFSCMKKPVYSLESVESQKASLLSISEDEETADLLDLYFDRMIAFLEGGRLSSIEEKISNINQALLQIMPRLMDSLIKSIHQNLELDSDTLKRGIQKNLFKFLKAQQCSVLSEALIEEYVNQIFDTAVFVATRFFVSGKQVSGETDKKIIFLMREMGNSQKEIISQCFPNYIWPENIKELSEKMEKYQLNSLRRFMQNVVLSRDQKMAQRMLPYFEQGGAFVAVGFAHLKGILEEFKAKGYEVKHIKLSKPLKEENN